MVAEAGTAIGDFGNGRSTKYGEMPSFGPVTPPRLLGLFGDDKDIFLKGRRCESQGLGIGAYSYYRRVVENHKDQIFDEIIKVAKKVSLPADKIEMLEAAKKKSQFSEAVDDLKPAIPEGLLIDGQHNPLSLLHKALSIGLHELDDTKCLEYAQNIRIVLADLAERIGLALKQQNELSAAVGSLLNMETKTRGKPPSK